MKITIHRGINQIGGCITEIASGSARIIIDLGQNLPRGDEPVTDIFASKAAIGSLVAGADAILYTHIHGDHFGLFSLVPDSITQYVGKVSKAVSLCKLRYLEYIPERKEQTAAEIAKVNSMNAFEALQVIQIKEIKITPFFVSHSAYDSYMFLIEVDGLRVLHTGDFRSHGYLGKGLIPTIEKFIVNSGNVDILITEGTMLSRDAEQVPHEKKIKGKFKKVFKEKKNVFVLSSSTDLERLASIYSAYNDLKRRPFVCDTYQADILNIFNESAGTHSGLFKFDKIYSYSERSTKLKNWMKSSGFCMLVRPTNKFSSFADSILARLDPKETILVYSMWSEYKNPESEHAKKDYLDFIKKFPELREIHTSGHASPQCLAEVCNLVNPRLGIIPIHSEKSADYQQLKIKEQLRRKVITESTIVENVIINVI